MKKFEELERIQKEFSSLQVEQTPVPEEIEENKTPDEVMIENELTQEQLEEVFKRTSAFTVKSATIDTSQVLDLDALDLWQIEHNDNSTNEIVEEDEYYYVDDSFWEDEFSETLNNKRNRKREPKQPGQTRRTGNMDRESIIAKYKFMQVQVQDRHGNYFTIKKKVSNVDPSLPTYVRIPARPISMSWANSIRPLSVPTVPKGSNYHEVSHLLSTDLTQYGNDFSAVYIDPPFLLPGEEPSPGKISIDDFAQLGVSNIVKAGFIFIWLEKEWLQKAVNIITKWGFKYVENFCWIKKNVNNQIATSPYTYFNKSKLSLLIFRKEGEIELRHQRNPDCVFDFIRPHLPDQVTEKKPPFMYKVIETLLPNAVYNAETNPHGGKLIELWAKKNTRREGWTSVVQVI
ncbi:uncharacterized protein B0P05DRAFT_544195 [Gilbertella persicaria]|nr:uncharacterized protein B0P05DRAFT_544195 [Gilbertella persicaria]KAI8077251.1 hypothetical protein B0P05DRAFT_544195 [Gilbertella persicaria]